VIIVDEDAPLSCSMICDVSLSSGEEAALYADEWPKGSSLEDSEGALRGG
jgi:hypothetical protein